MEKVIKRLGLTLLVLTLSSCSSTKVSLKNIQGCSVNYNGVGMNNSVNLISFPGNENFEDHFWDNLYRIEKLMGLGGRNLPEVYFYDDHHGSNAFALTRGLKGKSNYTVMFGENVIYENIQAIRNTNNLNTIALKAILGHEYAHIGQYVNNIRKPVKYQELMADVMSGWYIGYIYSNRGRVKVSRNFETAFPDIQIALDSVYKIGDYNIHGADHHGTPREREAAFYYGIKLALKYSITSYWEAFDMANDRY
jgi:hypothetical protein